MIIESRKRLRTDYEPLTIAVSLDVVTPHSATGQVYDPESNSYIPDREITPLVIVPIIRAMTKDGSWDERYANLIIADIKWFANGVNIATLSSWSTKYSIQDNGIDSGAISIFKNIETEQRIELHFEATIPDQRTGLNIPIQSDTITLFTVDKSADTWGVSLDCEQTIEYNPFLDKLLIYDYKIANGISAGSRAAAMDSNAYEKTIKMLVTRGGVEMSTGFTSHLYRLNGQTMTEMSSDVELISKSNSEIKLDLRFIEKKDYLILIKEDNVEVARAQFSIARQYPDYSVEVAFGASISPTDTIHRNMALVSHNGSVVQIPELLIRMIWFTDTSALQEYQWQEGSKCIVELLRTGIGKTYLDNWMEIYLSTEHKKAFDEYDYQDNDGNIYIGN